MACVVRNFVEEELASGALVEVMVEPPIQPRRIGIVTLRGVPMSKAAAAFVEMLGE
jgi:hypothetical protein